MASPAMSAVLPRVAWSIGQVLLPEHFRTLEASLIAEAVARASVDGLPDYGLLSLEWNGAAPHRVAHPGHPSR